MRDSALFFIFNLDAKRYLEQAYDTKVERSPGTGGRDQGVKIYSRIGRSISFPGSTRAYLL